MRRFTPVEVAVGAAVVLAAGAITFAWVVAARLTEKEGRVREPRGRLPAGLAPEAGALPSGLDLKGPSITRTDEQGNLLWSARSKGEFRLDNRTHEVVGTDVVWQLQRGAQRVTLAAPVMRVATSGGDVQFAGGVTITAPGNRAARVASARYEASTRKIIGQGGVQWQWGRFGVAGQSMVVSISDTKLRLRGHLHLYQR